MNCDEMGYDRKCLVLSKELIMQIAIVQGLKADVLSVRPWEISEVGILK